MSLELLNKVKKYIEYCEETIDGEWGSCRNIEELVADGAMPKVWYEVCEAIREQGGEA